MRDNHPWIKYTIEKLGGELTVNNQTLTAKSNGNSTQFDFMIRNSGLQDWNMSDEDFKMVIACGN